MIYEIKTEGTLIHKKQIRNIWWKHKIFRKMQNTETDPRRNIKLNRYEK